MSFSAVAFKLWRGGGVNQWNGDAKGTAMILENIVWLNVTEGFM